MKKTTTVVTALTVTAALAGTYAATTGGAAAVGADSDDSHSAGKRMDVEILAPTGGDNAGIGGAGWFVDLNIEFRDTALAPASPPTSSPVRACTTT